MVRLNIQKIFFKYQLKTTEMKCAIKRPQITDRLEAGDSREEITGIINIHKRIRLKFGKNSGLSVAPSEIGGLKVIIHIELQGKEEIDNVSLANC